MPSPEVIGNIRTQALQDLTQRYIADVERLGVAPDELKNTLNEQLARQRETDSLPRAPIEQENEA
jgi:hypothetical protein